MAIILFVVGVVVKEGNAVQEELWKLQNFKTGNLQNTEG